MLILHKTYDHLPVVVLTVDVDLIVSHVSLFSDRLLSALVQSVNPIFLPYIIMDPLVYSLMEKHISKDFCRLNSNLSSTRSTHVESG